MISARKLFFLIFIPALIMLFITLAFIIQDTDSSSKRQVRRMISDQWQIVSDLKIPETYSPSDHENMQKLMENTGLRITMVSWDGKLLTDSALSYEEIITAENHADREEIRSALLGEPLFYIRYSRSTKLQTVYYAKALDSGNVLRVSYPAEWYNNSNKIIAAIFVDFALVSAAAAVFAFFISRKLSAPFKKLSEALRGFDAVATLPSFNDPAIDNAVASFYLGKEELAAMNGTVLALDEKFRHIVSHISEGVILIDDDNGLISYNSNATDILQCKLNVGSDFTRRLADVDLIKFFNDLPKESTSGEIAHFKGKVLEISALRIGAQRLVVIDDITARAEYNSYKMDLIGNLSHELKTPLTLILGATETVLKNIDITAEERNRFLQTVYRNGLSLNRLLSDMLSLHKLENLGGANGITDTTEVALILSELGEQIEPLLDDKKINYTIEADKIRAHPSHILSILLNFVTNALKYSSGKEINVLVRKSKGEVVISVSDQGPAIPVSDRKRIFERFYSISQSRAREGVDSSGSGLGLSIVKHIVKLYHGHIKIEKNADGGNTFTVLFMERAE